MSAKNYPFDEISPWVQEPEDLRPALSKDTDADVVIVGGGYTGLSTALAMRRAGADVALLDARFAGSGATINPEIRLLVSILLMTKLKFARAISRPVALPGHGSWLNLTYLLGLTLR